MKKLAIAAVKFYRRRLSPLKGKPCCRFYPTCSQYALDAFEKRGFFVGLGLTLWRILRCNPLCRGGIEYVPDKPLKRAKSAGGNTAEHSALMGRYSNLSK